MTLKNITRRIATSGAVAAIAAIGFAGAAQAVTTSGCTATPLTPIYSYTNSAGVKVLDYRITVSCSSGRTAQITQERWEEDDWPNGDDLVGTSTFNVQGSTTLHNYRTLVDGELGMEEMYQKIRMRVSSNGVTSPWTGWQKSGVQAFYN